MKTLNGTTVAFVKVYANEKLHLNAENTEFRARVTIKVSKSIPQPGLPNPDQNLKFNVLSKYAANKVRLVYDARQALKCHHQAQRCTPSLLRH